MLILLLFYYYFIINIQALIQVLILSLILIPTVCVLLNF